MSDGDGWMTIGHIAGPFGVRGEIKVEVLTDFPERFSGLGRVYLGATHREFEMERSRRHKSLVVVKLQGIETPEDAEKLRGLDVTVPRSEAMPLPEGHYFLEDLIGLTVETSEGVQVGDIREVLRTGSNDVYVVNQGRGEILIPAIKDAVLTLDVDKRRLIVDPWVLLPPT